MEITKHSNSQDDLFILKNLLPEARLAYIHSTGITLGQQTGNVHTSAACSCVMLNVQNDDKD